MATEPHLQHRPQYQIIANGLGVLLTVDREKSTEKLMSAIGTIVSVST